MRDGARMPACPISAGNNSACAGSCGAGGTQGHWLVAPAGVVFSLTASARFLHCARPEAERRDDTRTSLRPRALGGVGETHPASDSRTRYPPTQRVVHRRRKARITSIDVSARYLAARGRAELELIFVNGPIGTAVVELPRGGFDRIITDARRTERAAVYIIPVLSVAFREAQENGVFGPVNLTNRDAEGLDGLAQRRIGGWCYEHQSLRAARGHEPRRAW
jgi:hypothetical protein